MISENGGELKVQKWGFIIFYLITFFHTGQYKTYSFGNKNEIDGPM